MKGIILTPASLAQKKFIPFLVFSVTYKLELNHVIKVLLCIFLV